MEQTAKALTASFTGRIERQPFGTFLVVNGPVQSTTRRDTEAIGERDYRRLSDTWRALLDGSGSLQFDEKLSRWQRETLLQAFATLLSRPTGRELVQFAVWHAAKHRIEAGAGYVNPRDTTRPQHEVGVPVYRNLEIVVKSFDDRVVAIPLFVALGHELGHVHSRSIGTSSEDVPLDNEYGNLEEWQNITRWENRIRREHGLPLRKGHFAYYSANIPLDHESRSLLHAIARGNSDDQVESPRGQALLRKLVALSKDMNPEVSDLERSTCRAAAEHLVTIQIFGTKRTYFAKAYSRELESAYAGIARLFPAKKMPVPDFETLNRNEIVAERKRLMRPRAALIRSPHRAQMDLLRTLNTLSAAFDALGIDNIDHDLETLARTSRDSPERG